MAESVLAQRALDANIDLRPRVLLLQPTRRSGDAEFSERERERKSSRTLAQHSICPRDPRFDFLFCPLKHKSYVFAI